MNQTILKTVLWAAIGGAVGALDPVLTDGLKGKPIDWDVARTEALCGAAVAVVALFRPAPNEPKK
jgi:hypothetical protein